MNLGTVLYDLAAGVFLVLVLIEFKYVNGWLILVKGVIAFGMVFYHLFADYNLLSACIWAVLLALQLPILWSSSKRKKKIAAAHRGPATTVVCPHCRQVNEINNLADQRCSSCGEKLI